MNNWHARSISELVLESGTDVDLGRPLQGTDHKRKKNNKIFRLPSTDPLSIVKKMASDASLILLAVTFLISAFTGNAKDSFLGMIVLTVAFSLGVYIKYRSSLRITNSYALLLPNAKVIENGLISSLSVYDVEVNDLITFSQGDIITADARLVSSTALAVAERVINENTGLSEFKKYHKDHLFISTDEIAIHSPNMVYAGSMVISGKGSAIVTAIGSDTEISKVQTAITIVSENDKPSFFNVFESKSKKFSLAVLLSVIPLCLLGLLLNSASGGDGLDIMTMFLLSLALAATTMSEPLICAAEAIITKEILPSSIASKSLKRPASKITKLSSAEQLALTDTLLILSPDVLIDYRDLVRNIYFAGKQYRFDAVHSKDVESLVQLIAPYYAMMTKSSVQKYDRIMNDFISSFDIDSISNNTCAKFLKNFPVNGCRTCALEFDNNGNPIKFISASANLSLLYNCNKFRTEGGGLWNLSKEDVLNAESFFNEYANSEFLTPIAFFSQDSFDRELVFEGIFCIGQEFPYNNSEVLENFVEAGVHPILILETENNRNLEIARRSGFLKSSKDLALYSEYQKAGLTVSDAHISTRIFVGFGRKGTQLITRRLADNSKIVLPIIKDTANRYDSTPYGIYATHSQQSLDSVKIASSLSISPNITEKRIGGLGDALKAVLSSSMSFLKLGIFKNYLVFSSLLRIFTVILPLLCGFTYSLISPVGVLICGFFCDFAALLSIVSYKAVPAKAKNAIAETNKLFSLSSSLVTSFCALIVSCILLCTTGCLVKSGAILQINASYLISIFVIVSSIGSLGGFLLILQGRTRSYKLDICFVVVILLVVLFIVVDVYMPFMGIFSLTSAVLPHIVALCAVSATIIVLIVGNLSSISFVKNI
jgi:hypothetical protein